MTPQHTYESLKNSLLSVEKYAYRNELSEHEHEALSDVLSALNLGKTAYVNHLEMWDDMNQCECCGWTEEDREYLKALKSLQAIIEEEK